MTVEQFRQLITDGGEKPLILGLVGLLFLATILTGVISNINVAYAVMVDGEQVALVAEEAEAHAVLKELIVLKGQIVEQAVTPVEEVTMTKIRSKDEKQSTEQLMALLDKHLNFTTAGTAIIVNGEQKVVVENETVAQQLIQDAKNSYIGQQRENVVVETAEIQENIEFATVEIGLDEYLSYDEALALMLHGTEKLEKHVIQSGDSLWTIARDNNLRVDDLIDANPQLNTNLLSIGQEINLVKIDPMINVVATLKETKKETIPYTTKFVNDSQLYRGQEKVTQPGERGEREVVYQLVTVNGVTVEKAELAANVVKTPTERVVSRGTKVVVASRGSGETSGKFGWPVNGKLTSPYGNRRGGFHSGIDVAASTGTSIRAADGGVVVFSGWSGNYGNMIDIDHGNGVITRYAHNSANLVSVGQRVSKGEVIGRVGSTGRSTGPHVHFEVRVNGSTKNPLNYLP